MTYDVMTHPIFRATPPTLDEPRGTEEALSVAAIAVRLGVAPPAVAEAYAAVEAIEADFGDAQDARTEAAEALQYAPARHAATITAAARSGAPKPEPLDLREVTDAATYAHERAAILATQWQRAVRALAPVVEEHSATIADALAALVTPAVDDWQTAVTAYLSARASAESAIRAHRVADTLAARVKAGPVWARAVDDALLSVTTQTASPAELTQALGYAANEYAWHADGPVSVRERLAEHNEDRAARRGLRMMPGLGPVVSLR